MDRETGFSIVELMISLGITVAVIAGVLSLVNPSQGTFSVQPESTDMQQRLRVAADTLFGDLVAAGAGAYSGAQAASLNYYFAPVLPFRQGAIGDDPVGTYRTDTITLLYVHSTDAQTTLAGDLTPGASTFAVNLDPGCPPGFISCGFAARDTVLIYDGTGNFDVFMLTGVSADGGSLTVAKPADAAATTFKSGSTIVQAVDRTYFLKADAANNLYQLMRYEGGTSPDVPAVDHVVGLTFEYYGDPQPPVLRKPLDDPTGPWTTYGPKPPPIGTQTTAYPAGENCLFQVDPASGLQIPRLGLLGGDPARTAPIVLTAAQLSDGPWCPDAANANRFDADLLRIRKVGITIRVESAIDSLRGPAGALFTRGGTARNFLRSLRDLEVRFQISPRNLNLGR